MTGNIHGRLNRSIEGTTKLVKLIFMDFAPAVATGIAAVFVIFSPTAVAGGIADGSGRTSRHTYCDASDFHTERNPRRTSTNQSRSGWDNGGTSRRDGNHSIHGQCGDRGARGSTGGRRPCEPKNETPPGNGFYDCLKFINEAAFNVAVIGISVLLAFQGAISVGTVLTAYLCFTQLTGPLRELHRILDEVSECTVLEAITSRFWDS